MANQQHRKEPQSRANVHLMLMLDWPIVLLRDEKLNTTSVLTKQPYGHQQFGNKKTVRRKTNISKMHGTDDAVQNLNRYNDFFFPFQIS